MSSVRCRGPARAAGPSCCSTACSSGAARAPIEPSLEVRLRAPGGRVIERTFRLPRPALRSSSRMQLSMPVPAPAAVVARRAAALRGRASRSASGGRVVQRERRRIGLRSVEVKGGHLCLNNRRIQLRGASIHEDMPGSGAALTGADMDRIVADLKDLGANITRAHYLMNDRLLSRFDRAGIMVWSQAPIWQRDARGAPAAAAEGARARAADGAAHGDRGAQPPLGAHPLGRQRADLHAGPAARHASASCSRRRRRRATSTRRCRSRSTSRAGRASPSSSPTTRST